MTIGSSPSFICISSSSIFILMTSLPSPEDCTLVSLPNRVLLLVHLCSSVKPTYSYQLCAHSGLTAPPNIKTKQASRIYFTVMLLKNVPTIKQKFSCKSVFHEVMGLTVPSCSAFPYHERTYGTVVYIFSVYTYFSKMYLFISNATRM